MRGVGLQSLFTPGQYSLPYKATTAVLTSETVTLGGRRLVLGRDYQPFARTPSGFVSTRSTYYAGDGSDSDYAGSVSGLVVFHYSKADGSFGGGVLDRILLAARHGATAVAVIADGDLKVSNFEHPLIAATIAVPAIFVSPDAAHEFGIPVDHRARSLVGNAATFNFTIKRNSGGSAADLVGVVPGSSESPAVLWVTNIDGFGSLPDGGSFASAISGSTAAAMMLDLAQTYVQNPPPVTQIFAFIGSKWTDKAGAVALANRLNWSHVGAVLDLYAMGGTGQRDRINVTYQEASFKDVARALMPSAALTTDLGNATTSVLSEYSNRTLLLRDLDTWIDDSRADTPSVVTDAAYATGVRSLEQLAADLMRVITISPPPIAATLQWTQAPNDGDLAGLQTLSSSHFNIVALPSETSLFSSETLGRLEDVYAVDDFYNYEVQPSDSVTALFIKDGVVAARVCGRSDLVSNPDAAGGGFANVVSGHPCIYQHRSDAIGEPLWFGNVAHELNHALASLQGFYTSASVLQEWQGQSQFVRYDTTGHLPTTVAALVQSFIDNGEVPRLEEIIANYSKDVDWRWFTAGMPNPYGHLYTYYIAGSMYAFLADQYGAHASRRAMYRNYADVSSFESNMAADTGLTFADFAADWAYWMTHQGTPMTQVSPERKASIDRNNDYDNMLLYSLPDTGSFAASSNVDSTSSSLGLDLARLNAALAAGGAPDITISSLNIVKAVGAYDISISLKSGRARSFAAFVPPSDILARSAAPSGPGVLRFTLPQSQVDSATELAWNFYTSDSDRTILFIDPRSIAQAAQSDGSSGSLASTSGQTGNLKLAISRPLLNAQFVTTSALDIRVASVELMTTDQGLTVTLKLTAGQLHKCTAYFSAKQILSHVTVHAGITTWTVPVPAAKAHIGQTLLLRCTTSHRPPAVVKVQLLP